MEKYIFWNNKGGTGKTSLCFQSVVSYAESHLDKHILVVDLCPQANLSELMLGGLMGNGSSQLAILHANTPRKSIGGYFDKRILSPYSMPAGLDPADFIVTPANYNANIPDSVDLLAGDSIVELQATYMSAIANGSLPNGQSPYAFVLCWLKDLLLIVSDVYDLVFIDSNPSFSLYTQVAIAASDKMIVPVMADDSSRRALLNLLALIYGYNIPAAYAANNFNTVMTHANLTLPKIHLIVKNRITQYMGPASGYRAVLQSIDRIIAQVQATNPAFFTTQNVIVEVRDFQTTGVIAFAEAKSFNKLLGEPLVHSINGNTTTLNRGYIQQNKADVDTVVGRL